ncbi:MAG: poly-gamma-glutamate system protein [Bacteroidetes bacterium]|nr:poly-gamma-glutamate system protein [Bacteroidota bacterium]
MSRSKINSKSGFLLSLIFVGSLAGVSLLRTSFQTAERDPHYLWLKKSAGLTQHWFNIIKEKKIDLGISGDSKSIVPNSFMIGDEYTPLTTTLGSLEAKELSTNPDYSAVILKMLFEEGIDSSSKIGITISGSFPALAIASLAACKTIGAKVVLFSSLGSSSHGANQPLATWLDYEHWLVESGELPYRSAIVTKGAENDMGEGMLEDADSIFISAAGRNGYSIYQPADLLESINRKTELLVESKISLLINIGGNHASLGSCAHAVSIPNGYNKPYKICSDEERGIINRVSEEGIPFIHLLNIKDLSVKSGIPLEPGMTYGDSENVYFANTINKYAAVLLLIVILSFLLSFKYYQTNLRKPND